MDCTRCTGHCCSRLTLSFGPRRLRRMAREDKAPDIKQIAAMLLYVGYQRVGKLSDSPEWTRKKAHFYRCANLVDGNCSIYESRPKMCREYPYGERCSYAKCTWSAVKSEKPPAVEEYGVPSD
jgi:Fe-S-cluster containining protein